MFIMPWSKWLFEMITKTVWPSIMSNERPYRWGKAKDRWRTEPPRARQFLKLWIGAGIRPPRVTNASQLVWFTGMIGA